MIRKLFIATLLSCGLMCAAAVAQPPQGGPGTPGGPGFGHRFGPGRDGEMHGGIRPLLPPGRWWKNAEVAKAIALNDGQVQKIEQIFQDSRMKLVDIHANLQKEEIKLEPLLEADNPDEGAVLAAIDRITSARAALEKANAQMAFTIRRVLTPDQWKKLRSPELWKKLRGFRRDGDFPPPADGPRRHFPRDDDRPHQDQPPAPPSAPPTPSGPGSGSSN
jgi:Spy/CpxP family protein refolding chaperone